MARQCENTKYSIVYQQSGIRGSATHWMRVEMGIGNTTVSFNVGSLGYIAGIGLTMSQARTVAEKILAYCKIAEEGD
jgi:hypothetical protein